MLGSGKSIWNQQVLQIISLIDGSHIPILPPSDGYKDFVNCNGWPCYVLQAVVNHRCWYDICRSDIQYNVQTMDLFCACAFFLLFANTGFVGHTDTHSLYCVYIYSTSVTDAWIEQLQCGQRTDVMRLSGARPHHIQLGHGDNAELLFLPDTGAQHMNLA